MQSFRVAPLITPADLADGAAAAPLLDADGNLVDPVLLLDRDAPDDPRALGAALDARRILIGVASRAATGALAASCDLTLVPRDLLDTDHTNAGRSTTPTLVGVDDPPAAAAALVDAVHANPQAATVLVGLLRSEFPAARAALDAESLAYSTLLGGPEFRRWLEGTPRPAPPPDVADPVLVRREARTADGRAADGPAPDDRAPDDRAPDDRAPDDRAPDDQAAGEILRVTLNRPERRNAYGRAVRDGLVAALDVARALARADGPPGPAGPRFRIVLDGAGPVFCAGGDLGEFGTAPDPVTAHLVRTHAGAAWPLLELGDRIEARLHGSCVGAGVELPAFARRVTAAPGTTFRLPEVAMGLIPGAGGTVSLPHRIGRWRTLYLALSGVELDLETALSWGLVDAAATADDIP